MRTHEGPHDPINPHPGCFGCAVKAKGINLGAGATPTRRPGGTPKFRGIRQPSWEAGVTGERRADGSFMPYVDGNLEPIGVKEMADQRPKLEAIRHQQLHDPNYTGR